MSLPSWARRRVKVVCIVSEWPAAYGADDIPSPVRGETYTLNEVIADDSLEGGGAATLFEFGVDGFYTLDGFRPLVTRSQKQDIAEHFSHHLRTDQRVPEKA